jgi:TolB-like protein/tetratricopeptide (TPR) repeat protein
MLFRAPLLACLAGTALVIRLEAQCPDGTPPPCGTARPIARPVAVLPPLDERNWIVVPFDNLSKSSEVEWLRDASVNLLSLDLSRWSDIKVVDDKRVSDLVRALPRAAAGQLSLNDGLSVARRAGAGRLVMGEVLRIGSRTTVQARVINVKDGSRLRLVRDETAVADSLMPMFGRLAEKVLDVAPPPGANVGAIGTSRADAYQEYLTGYRALRQFDLGSARPHLLAALKLDSTFALAHLTMALLIGWDDSGSPERVRYAQAAERFGGTLPPRERALISGLVAFYGNDYVRSCETYERLVKADSSDVLALYGLGDCSYHDAAIVPMAGDSTRFRFRGDWNVSFRAFERALQVDPGFQLAVQHMIDALTTEVRIGCRGAGQSCSNMGGPVRWTGDSLVIDVVSTVSPEFTLKLDEARVANVLGKNLERALVIAQTWAANAPPEGRSHAALGHIYLSLGRLDQAARELDLAGKTVTGSELGRVLADRIELAVKQWDAPLAHRYFDSISVVIPPGGRSAFRAQYGLLFGRYAAFDSLLAIAFSRNGAPPAVAAYQKMFTRVLLGRPPADAAEREAEAFADAARAPGCNAACQAEQVSLTLALGLRMARKTWPPLDPGLTRPSQRAALAASRGDSAMMRQAVQRLDSVAAALHWSPEATTASLVAVEASLWLGDSLGAYRRVSHALDSLAPVTPFRGNSVAQLAPLLAREMLLRADLAAGLGRREDAGLWYGRFLAFWSDPDPEFRPLIDRIRKAQ